MVYVYGGNVKEPIWGRDPLTYTIGMLYLIIRTMFRRKNGKI